MDVKEAVAIAKRYITDLFADEGIAHLGLEEVLFDEWSGDWKVTIGFAPPLESVERIERSAACWPA